MPKSSPSTDNAQRMLRDLLAAEALVASLEATAPLTIASAGGAHKLVAESGTPTGAWFWFLRPMSESLWASMADEHQAEHRANAGA